MRLNVKALAAAAGTAAAASYVVCALAVALAPGLTSRFFSYVFHIDLTGLSRMITWGSFFGGIVCFSALVAAHVALAAWCYNQIVGSTSSIRSARDLAA